MTKKKESLQGINSENVKVERPITGDILEILVPLFAIQKYKIEIFIHVFVNKKGQVPTKN